MERKRYLELCQQFSIGNNVLVVYDGVAYRPKNLLISFDKNGKCKNSAILKDVNCNSERQVLLERVREYEKEI